MMLPAPLVGVETLEKSLEPESFLLLISRGSVKDLVLLVLLRFSRLNLAGSADFRVDSCNIFLFYILVLLFVGL